MQNPKLHHRKGITMNRKIEIIVSIEIDSDADIQTLISEMQYEFRHDDIKSTEIIDLITEI